MSARPQSRALSRPVPRPEPRRPDPQRTFWALVDVTLLFLVIGTASDMIVNFGPVQSLVWLACYGMALVRIAMAWPHFLAVLARDWVVLSYPAVCLASVLWSFAPAGTLVAGIQLLMTVLIGCYLGLRYSLAMILKCFLLLMVVAAALSLLHGATGIFPWPTHTGAGGLAGLFQHKNMLGQKSLFAVTIAVGSLLLSRSEPGWLPRPVLFGAIGICVVALVLSESMTSVLLLPAMAGLVLLMCLRRVTPGVAIGGLAALVLGVSLGPVALTLGGIDPVGTVLGAVGKDATLTGRTVLWDIAAQARDQYPILGTGFRAFWLAPEFANGRLMTAEAGARQVASFHNFVLEIQVSVGWPGLIAMAATILACGSRLWRLFRRDRMPTPAVGLALLIGFVVTSLLGTSLCRAHEITIVLLAAMTVTAGEALRRPVPASATPVRAAPRPGRGRAGPRPEPGPRPASA